MQVEGKTGLTWRKKIIDFSDLNVCQTQEEICTTKICNFWDQSRLERFYRMTYCILVQQDKQLNWKWESYEKVMFLFSVSNCPLGQQAIVSTSIWLAFGINEK